MTGAMLEKGRSADVIRRSLEETRRQLHSDLTELGDRVEHSLNPRYLVQRHPAMLALAGGILGALLVRRPALILRGAGKLLRWGAPVLLSALLRPSSPAEEARPRESESSSPAG